MVPPTSPRLSWPISPLIQITLISLYLSLTVPLPFLAAWSGVGIAPGWLWLALTVGLIGLVGILSEQVVSTEETLQVRYPRWVFWAKHKGWSLAWSEIESLKMRTTGQGGLVYYLTKGDRQQAYLLPQRVAGFRRLVEEIEAKTGIDTTEVKPLAQPWMYFILLGFTVLMGLMDVWTISTAQQLLP